MFSVLEKLDLDIVFTIKTFLDFDDTARLALTCKQLHDWLHEEVVCRYTVQHDAGHTIEAQEARAGRCSYRQAFERIYKRHAAVATAKPYSIRILGDGSAFRYCGGTLSWLSENRYVFTMSAHESSISPRRLDIGALARQCQTDWAGQIRLLSGLGNIIVVTLESRLSKWTWLIAIAVDDDVQEVPKLIVRRKIRSDRNIFARQSATHLVYGFQTTRNPCREEATWQIEIIQLDITDRESEYDDQAIAFHRLYQGFGVALGRDVDFTIHEGYFYAVSTRLAAKLVDGDWVSFYDCMWIPLSTPIESSTESVVTPQSLRWELAQIHRRCGSEGPINDTWTTLRLEPDQVTNQLMIVETRREWVNGSSRQIRSCYVQPLLRPLESTLSQSSPIIKSDSKDYFDPPLSLGAARDAHAFLHHNTTPAKTSSANPTTSTKFRSYNLSAKSFVEVTEIEGCLCVQVSAAANMPTCPDESIRAAITAQGRQETVIFHSKAAARSFPIASSQFLKEISAAKTASSSGKHSRIEGSESDAWDDYTAAADDRCIVFMSGSKGDESRPIILVSFDPLI